MSQHCTRCGGTGFLNVEQIPESAVDCGDSAAILLWVESHGDHDVAVCDCCGDGENWHGIPGEHYNDDDPPGPGGPYAYNGGLCECH